MVFNLTLKKLLVRKIKDKQNEGDKNVAIEICGWKQSKYLNNYENKQIFEICTYVNNQLHGKRFWYSNGRLCTICNFVNNKLHGKCLSWYSNGEFFSICNYVNDKLHGKLYEWYSNGELWENCNYVNGIKFEKR